MVGVFLFYFVLVFKELSTVVLNIRAVLFFHMDERVVSYGVPSIPSATPCVWCPSGEEASSESTWSCSENCPSLLA